MTDVIERRAIPQRVELREAPEGSDSPGILTGYGAVFNQLSRDLGGWFEEIAPEAFGAPGTDGAVDMERHGRVMGRSEHSSKLLLGTTDAGTLRLFLDDVGLRYEIDLPNTGAGRDAAVLAGRGDYAFSSFAFRVLPEGAEWRIDGDDKYVRRVIGAQLVDVAPVADPAYWGSSAELQRAFDLDEVRASLNPPPAPPGEREQAAAESWRSKNTRLSEREALAGHRRRRGGKKGVSR